MRKAGQMEMWNVTSAGSVTSDCVRCRKPLVRQLTDEENTRARSANTSRRTFRKMGLKQWFIRYARTLGSVAKGGFLTERRMNAQYPFLIFLAILAIVSIRSSHLADEKVHRISELRKELKNVHSDFVETRSQLMESSAETKVREYS